MMNDQASRLRRQMELEGQIKNAKAISIVSGKGGVGKSSFAINFSLELIKQGKKVLLFDLDVGMGNIDILLGIHANTSFVEMFHRNLSIHDIIETGPNNLEFIAGGSGLHEFFVLNENMKRRFYEEFKELSKMYDYIIFDMGAGISLTSLFFVLATDECIVVTTPEPTAIMDAYSIIKHIAKKDKDKPIHVIMNKVTSQISAVNALEQFEEIVYNFLDIKINRMGILPDDRIVNQAVMKQVPFVLLNENSNITKSLKQITTNYIMNYKKLNELNSVTFLQKLKSYLKRK